jgi:hypothetical protein
MINRLFCTTNNNQDQDELVRDDPRIPFTATSRFRLPAWDPAIAKLDDAARWLSDRCTLHLQIKDNDDDIAAMEASAPQWAEQVCNALFTRPTSPPFTISEHDRPKW